MVAVAESVGTPDAMFGPIIVVDTVVGYGWMGVLLFLSASYAQDLGRPRNNSSYVRDDDEATEVLMIEARRFAGAVLAVAIGDGLPTLGDPTIISHTTWAVLIVVTVGLALSFTPVRRLEAAGASRLGYLALYLLLTAIGAQADLKAVLEAPLFLAAGVLWIAIHAAILLFVARLIKAPLFFFATGSMANIGGAASAPVVAGVYHPAMAPVGLLMAVLGYVLGIYAALGCAALLAAIGG